MKKGRKDPKKGTWDLVPIGEEFLQDKEMENLISLEVLTDYTIVTKPSGIAEIVSSGSESGKGKKRKLEEDDDEVEDDDEDFSGPEMDKDEEVEEIISDEEKEEVVTSPKKKVKLEKNKKGTKTGKAKEDGKSKVAATSEWAVVDVKGENAAAPEKFKKGPVKGDKKKKQAKKEMRPAPASVVEDNLDREDDEFCADEWMKVGVRDPVLGALKEVKFNKPTTIQSLSLPAALLGNKDVVGAAETGSGKTLAFAIPIIQGILHKRKEEGEQGSLQALILTPTRELAVQIKNHFDVAAKYANIKTVVIVGGLAAQKQERLLMSKPHVVIATPGRLWELTKEGDPHLSSLDQIKYLAIDETDRMVERGHFQELEGILGVINKFPEVKEKRQNFVFSATLSFTHDPPQRRTTKQLKHQPKKVSSKEKLQNIMELVGVRPNPKIVDICSAKGTCENLVEKQINCPLSQKELFVYYFFIQHPGRTIVFCNSINTVRRLTNLFFLLKVNVLPLHSEMHQKMRLRNLERFTADDKGILIATDVAARGLDISNIQHVIHFQVPKTAESYIHRSGRTARAFKGGLAMIIVEPGEIGTLKNIFKSLNRDPDVMLPGFSVESEVFRKLKSRVEEAEKVEKFEHMVRKKLADMSWIDKAKKDMDLASSDDEYDSDDGKQQNKKNLLEAKKKLDKYKQALNTLLADNSFLLRKSIKM